MKAAWLITVLLVLFASGTNAVPTDKVDERKPYGSVCLSVTDASHRETPLDAAALPAAGKLTAHIDANGACDVLIAAFDSRDGRLANGWRPQYAAVPGWEEIRLPVGGADWNLAGAKPFECYVLFLKGDSQDARELKRLVGLMQAAVIDERLLALQTGKLRELVTKQLAGGDKASHIATVLTRDGVGGTFRGSANDFPWQQFSVRVNLSEDQPGLLIFSGGGKTASAR